MNAKEAREKAQKFILSENQGTIIDIGKIIEKTVNKGEFYCDYYRTVNVEVKSYFEERGFKVTYRDEGGNDFANRFDW